MKAVHKHCHGHHVVTKVVVTHATTATIIVRHVHVVIHFSIIQPLNGRYHVMAAQEETPEENKSLASWEHGGNGVCDCGAR